MCITEATPTGADVNYRGQLLTWDQSIAKLKQPSVAEKDFRRLFQRDGLLSGEYTSGIAQAFKKLRLDDLIGGQITKVQQKINDLDKAFEELRCEMSQTGVNWAGELKALGESLQALVFVPAAGNTIVSSTVSITVEQLQEAIDKIGQLASWIKITRDGSFELASVCANDWSGIYYSCEVCLLRQQSKSCGAISKCDGGNT